MSSARDTSQSESAGRSGEPLGCGIVSSRDAALVPFGAAGGLSALFSWVSASDKTSFKETEGSFLSFRISRGSWTLNVDGDGTLRRAFIAAGGGIL